MIVIKQYLLTAYQIKNQSSVTPINKGIQKIYFFPITTFIILNTTFIILNRLSTTTFVILPTTLILLCRFYLPFLRNTTHLIPPQTPEIMNKKDNKDIIQSYIFTVAKYDFSVYEKRIIYRQIEIEQELLENKKIGDGVSIDTTIWGNKRYTIPLRFLLKDDEDKNHSQIAKAFESLLKKTISYEDQYTKEGFGIIQEYKIEKRGSFVSWVAHPRIVEATMNFAKGYRKYELITAMTFESVYSMRFYELLSGQKEPLTYSIEDLKERFQITGKYKQINDFLKRVIDPAKSELDAKSPYSFTYKPNKIGRKFTSITFYPIYQPEHRDPTLERIELQRKISPSWDLTKNVLDYLKHGFLFTTPEIKQQIDIFKQAQNEIPDFINFMSAVKARASRAKNPKGYLINSIKKELAK